MQRPQSHIRAAPRTLDSAVSSLLAQFCDKSLHPNGCAVCTTHLRANEVEWLREVGAGMRTIAATKEHDQIFLFPDRREMFVQLKSRVNAEKKQFNMAHFVLSEANDVDYLRFLEDEDDEESCTCVGDAAAAFKMEM